MKRREQNVRFGVPSSGHPCSLVAEHIVRYGASNVRSDMSRIVRIQQEFVTAQGDERDGPEIS
jgi:hypothetical protein